MIVVTSGRRTAVRLSHPLYGEVLRSGLAPLRLRRIYGQLADAVEIHGARRREDIVRVALWRVESGGHVQGDCLLSAARLALAGHDPALAIRLISATPDDDEDLAPGDRAEVLVEAHAMLGHDDEVERLVAEVWDEPLGNARRAYLARRLAETRFYQRRDLDGRPRRPRRSARALLTDPEEIAAVDARRATLLAGAGRPAEALRITDAMAVRRRTDAGRARQRHGREPAQLGRCDAASAISRRAAADHAELPGWLARRGIAQHLVNEVHALAYSGRYAEARELLEAAAERARAPARWARWVWFEMALAEIARDTGRGHEAIRRFPRSPTLPAAPGRMRRSCGRTSASPRATCCSASATQAAAALAPGRRGR